jgi:hypothetical protein
MSRQHIVSSRVDRRRGLSAINAEATWPRGLTLGSARRLTSRAVGHVAASGLRLSGEQKRRSVHGMVRTRVGSGPRLVLIKVRVLFVPESWDPAVSGLDPTQRRPGPIPGVRFAPVEVLDLTRRSGPYTQGSGTSHGGSDLLLIPWRILSSLATWRPWSCPHGGVGCCSPRD